MKKLIVVLIMALIMPGCMTKSILDMTITKNSVLIRHEVDSIGNIVPYQFKGSRENGAEINQKGILETINQEKLFDTFLKAMKEWASRYGGGMMHHNQIIDSV